MSHTYMRLCPRRYAKETVAYFLDLSRIWNNRYVSRLLDIIRTPTAAPLLEQLQASEDRLVSLVVINCPEALEAAGLPPPPAPSACVHACAPCARAWAWWA